MTSFKTLLRMFTKLLKIFLHQLTFLFKKLQTAAGFDIHNDSI